MQEQGHFGPLLAPWLGEERNPVLQMQELPLQRPKWRKTTLGRQRLESCFPLRTKMASLQGRRSIESVSWATAEFRYRLARRRLDTGPGGRQVRPSPETVDCT